MKDAARTDEASGARPIASSPPRRRAVDGAFAALVVAAALAAQASAAGNDFFGDDYLHLYQMRNEGLPSFLFAGIGGHFLAVRNLALYVCHSMFGWNPAPYVWVALAAHAVNAGVLYAALARSVGDRGVALAAALLWGTCLTHRGSIGWISAHGHVLGTAAFLVAMLVLFGTDRPSRGRLSAIVAALALGAACFGAVLAAVAVFAVVAALAAPPRVRASAVRWSIGLLAGLAIGYAGYLEVDTAMHPPVAGARAAGFQPPFSVGATARFGADLAGAGVVALVSGNTSAFGTLAEPSLAALAVFVVALAAASVGADSRGRSHLAAWLVIAAAAYAATALARASMFAMFGADLGAMALAPRYHYFAEVGLCGALAVAAAAAGRRRPTNALRAAFLIFGVAVALANVARGLGASPYRGESARVAQTVAAIEEAARRAPGASVCLDNRPVPWIELVGFNEPEDFPGLAALFVAYFPSDVVEGKRVYFVERDARVREAARRREGTRMHSLLVAPNACPAS